MKRSPFAKFKDAALEKGVMMFAKPHIERYGEILDFSIDTTARTITAEVILHGDATPLEVEQAHYRLEGDADKPVLVLHDVKVSKPWVQHLLEDHFQEIRVPVPDFVRRILK